jgi:hypothetical protein
METQNETRTGLTPAATTVERVEHKHGLDEWWPMLPERSSESVNPDAEPEDRTLRCQFVGCTEVVRISRSQ